jgi:hypothetical protein
MDALPIMPLWSGTPKTRHFSGYRQATDHALLTQNYWAGWTDEADADAVGIGGDSAENEDKRIER